MTKSNETRHATLDTSSRLAAVACLLILLMSGLGSTSIRAAQAPPAGTAPPMERGEGPEGLRPASWGIVQRAVAASKGHRTAGAWAEAAKLDPDDGDAGDWFGYSLAISGDTIVVGAMNDENPNGGGAGAVYVFERGGSWSDGHVDQVAKLDPDDGSSSDFFGWSVAIDGDTIVVGAPKDDDPNGEDAGSVYVFARGSGWQDGHANQVAKLDPDDGDGADYFGQSVAISGDIIVVGAPLDEDPNGNIAGSAYVFERGVGWSDGHANQVAKLDPQDGGGGDMFGDPVAIDGDTIVVGAPSDFDPNGSFAGSAYVFEEGTSWRDGHANQVAKLYPDDGDSADEFGNSITIDGGTIVVGAHFDEDPNGAGAGSAYVFERGANWGDGHANQVAKLDPDDGDDADYFGGSVAISGDTIVVGAVYDEDPNGDSAGSAYVFERGASWGDGHANQRDKLSPDDGDSSDLFGFSVAISSRTIAIGAFFDEDPNGSESGSVYVFTPAAGNRAPFFTSTAVTAAFVDTAYGYAITASDPDPGDVLTITAATLPAWLTLTDHGDGTATLSGTPSIAAVGDHAVALQVQDSALTDTQSFTIRVRETEAATVYLPAVLCNVDWGGPPVAPVTAVGVETTDGANEQRMAFRANETIRLALSIHNGGPSPVDVDASWEVRNPNGALEQDLSWSGTLSSVDPGQWRYYIDAQLPASLLMGDYTFTGSVMHGGQTTSEHAVFHAAGSAALIDDFGDPGSGWSTLVRPDYTQGYVNNEYQILVSSPQWLVASSAPCGSLGNLVMEVDARSAASVPGAYGLQFAKSGDDYYVFMVSTSGRYLVAKETAAGWETLDGWSESEHVSAGQASNHLMVVRHGDAVGVYANGGHIATVTDTGLTSGSVAVVGWAFSDPNADLRFDQFRAYHLDAAQLSQGWGAAGDGLDRPDALMTGPLPRKGP